MKTDMGDEDIPGKGEVVIYTAPDGAVRTEVKLQDETLWLAEQQIAQLFGRDRTVIGRHIKAIFNTAELEETSNVQKMHIPNSDKPVTFYSLDMILSIGYRVNSKQGTLFRIWANRILKEHLVAGFTVNERRLEEKAEQLQALKSAIAVMERTVLARIQEPSATRELLGLLGNFAKGLELLDDFDHERLDDAGETKKEALHIEPEEFLSVIEGMKEEFGPGIFGREKDESFAASVSQMYQTFGSRELYPSLEEKAAILLYLVVKNHSFVDGNKRIAAALFLHFLDRNRVLYRPDGRAVLSPEALAALTLLLAESKSEEKDTMQRLVVSILNRGRREVFEGLR